MRCRGGGVSSRRAACLASWVADGLVRTNVAVSEPDAAFDMARAAVEALSPTAIGADADCAVAIAVIKARLRQENA